MNKILLVIQREYLVRVRKKSFLYTTILVPLVIMGFYGLMFAIGASKSHEKNKIAVLDEAGLFSSGIENSKSDESTYTIVTGQSLEALKGTYKSKGYDYILYIPPMDVSKDAKHIQLFSSSPLNIIQKGKIERTVDNAIENKRLQSANISREQYHSIQSDVSIENPVLNGKEEKKNIAFVAQGVSFFCGFLIYLIMIIYGTMVMRGVMEEKISRIAEVMISSVKPFQLMMGKIIGIGAVGLTQFAIWIALIAVLKTVLHIPGLDATMMQQPDKAQGGALTAMITGGLGNLPWGLIVSCFIFYFLGGYLLYASLFAAVGSVVSDDQSEAQQFVFPIMMPILLGFVIMTKAMNDPNSPLVIFGSLFPLTSPVVMMGRIMYNVSVTQIIASMLLLILGILFFTWLTAKIYRTGILMYGKKVTWKEMIKWAFRKN